MVVDWAVADVAAAEVWNESLTKLVQQRTAEQDWNARRASVSIDVDHASRLHVGWVERHGAVVVVGNLHAVKLKKLRNDLNVADVRNLTQDAGVVA